ncbi:MAG: hypothetical protein ACRC31_00980, partial [Cetobacterium sp.]
NNTDYNNTDYNNTEISCESETSIIRENKNKEENLDNKRKQEKIDKFDLLDTKNKNKESSYLANKFARNEKLFEFYKQGLSSASGKEIKMTYETYKTEIDLLCKNILKMKPDSLDTEKYFFDVGKAIYENYANKGEMARKNCFNLKIHANNVCKIIELLRTERQ